jgi:SAM-dependent methyltransferase
MHDEAKNFTLFVKSQFPEYFDKPVKVLDVGSGDINGNNRFLFHPDSEYHGNDMFQAKNVTIVCKTSELPFEDESFDVIVSTECFEHDPEWDLSLKKISKMLKPNGLFFFTCGGEGRGEHGTRRTTPENCFATIAGNVQFQDHYRNLVISDVKTTLDLSEYQTCAGYYRASPIQDLYFYGKKTNQVESKAEYSDKDVVKVL